MLPSTGDTMTFTIAALDEDTRIQLQQALATVGDPNQLLDTQLGVATWEALRNNKITPLIKEELRCMIQAKRLKKGDEELVVEQKPTSVEELTEEEEVKRAEKRKRNCLAARKCRDKKRQRTEELEMEVLALEAEQKKHNTVISLLKNEKSKLLEMLAQHDQHAECGELMIVT